MSQSQSTVMKIYRSVIDDVITGVRDAFLDEGVDEQVLQELKQLWESKLVTSKAVEVNPDPPEPQVPQFVSRDSRNNIALKSGHVVNMYTHTHNLAQHAAHGPQHQPVTTAGHGVAMPAAPAPALAPATQPQLPAQPQQQTHTAHGQLPGTHTVIVTDPNKQVPIQITLPSQAGGDPRVLTIQVPASALQGNQLQQVLTGPVISATMALPPHLASSLLQQHVTAALQGQASTGATAALVQQAAAAAASQQGVVRQLDGAGDTSDDDDEEEEEDEIDDEDDNDDKEEEENEEDNLEGQEEEPLNSGDDVSDEDPTDLFDTDNVVVCQYDKITRSRNKWKFYLKDGIMNLNGKDFVFQKASGDAEW